MGHAEDLSSCPRPSSAEHRTTRTGISRGTSAPHADHRVERVPVLGGRVRDEAVVGRIHDRREQEPVELDPAQLLVLLCTCCRDPSGSRRKSADRRPRAGDYRRGRRSRPRRRRRVHRPRGVIDGCAALGPSTGRRGEAAGPSVCSPSASSNSISPLEHDQGRVPAGARGSGGAHLGRQHDRVDAELGHAQRAAHLAESGAVAEVVDRGDRPALALFGSLASAILTGAVRRGTLEELLRPLRDDPERSAVLLDVDGVLAPIVQHPDDAHMPETTRRPLIEVARRYGVVACVSGRRASDARRIVSLGSIAYLGSHGSEVLMPGAIAPELDRELQAWTRRVQAFATSTFNEKLRRLRVRLEDKEAIAALHWRGVPDEDDSRPRSRRSPSGRGGRLRHPLGPQGARDPAAGADRQGRRDRRPAARPDLAAAVYVGDDVTDLDAFRGLTELQERGPARLRAARRRALGRDAVGARGEADIMVDGTDGVRSPAAGAAPAPDAGAVRRLPQGDGAAERRRRRRCSPR